MYKELFHAVVSSLDNEVEQEDLTQSLSLVKDVIGAVDSKVASYEKKVRLGEIYTKTDSKSIMRMKSGQMFAKEDLKRKKLVRDGSVFLKSATGRLKGKTAAMSVCLGRTGKTQILLDFPATLLPTEPYPDITQGNHHLVVCQKGLVSGGLPSPVKRGSKEKIHALGKTASSSLKTQRIKLVHTADSWGSAEWDWGQGQNCLSQGL